MPKPFKIHSTRPLPQDAEIIQHEVNGTVRRVKEFADLKRTEQLAAG
jgi:hypothetical protein